MIPLETKQLGGKILPHSNLRGGGGVGVSRGGITDQKKDVDNYMFSATALSHLQ
jgi:hypothetical protein